MCTRKGSTIYRAAAWDKRVFIALCGAIARTLVDNIYVLVGNKIFRQRIGIPMGTDCAPLLANLYLFKLEYKFMKNLLKTNMSKARPFSNTFRYIDDLLTLNNPSFGNVIGDIISTRIGT